MRQRRNPRRLAGAALAPPGSRIDAAIASECIEIVRVALDRYEELALAVEQPVTLLLTLISDRREREIRRALCASGDVLLLTSTIERHHADPLAGNWLPKAGDPRLALEELTRA